jgi:hypothetical protein
MQVKNVSLLCAPGLFRDDTECPRCIDCPAGYFSADITTSQPCESCASYIDCDGGTWPDTVCDSLGTDHRPVCTWASLYLLYLRYDPHYSQYDAYICRYGRMYCRNLL